MADPTVPDGVTDDAPPPETKPVITPASASANAKSTSRRRR